MYFPIGDIHGAYDDLCRLYEKIVKEIEAGGVDGTIVFLGDYIDYGPDSKKVLDFLMKLENTDNIKHVFLKGNHEEFITHCRNDITDHHTFDIWHYNGGSATLDSFNIGHKELYAGEIDEYIDWLWSLPLIDHDTEYVFVHAGININKALRLQNSNEMLWKFYRNPEQYKNYNKIIVHGHSMKRNGPIIDLENNRIWMDNGMNLFHKPATVALPEFNDETDSYPKIIWA